MSFFKGRSKEQYQTTDIQRQKHNLLNTRGFAS